MNSEIFDVIKSIAICFAIGALLMVVWNFTIFEWQQEELAQLQDNCVEPDCVFTFDPVLSLTFLLIPPVVLYFILMNYFEKKRLKTWEPYR